MSGYIKYFDDGGKNMSYKIENDNVFFAYNEIWNKIKKTLEDFIVNLFMMKSKDI